MYYVITKGGGSENGNFWLRSVLKVITKGRGGKTSNLDYVIHGWSQSKADGDEFVEYQLYFISTVFLSLPTLKKSEKEMKPKIMWFAKIIFSSVYCKFIHSAMHKSYIVLWLKFHCYFLLALSLDDYCNLSLYVLHNGVKPVCGRFWIPSKLKQNINLNATLLSFLDSLGIVLCVRRK